MKSGYQVNLKNHKNTYVKTPIVYQMEVTECGAASLAIVLGYFGRYVSLEDMRIQCGVSRNGSNLAQIYNAAVANGLKVRAVRSSFGKLLDKKPPCIIHWNFNHFVVWEGIKGNYCYINDPAVGRRKLTAEEVDNYFTGIVLSFEEGEDFKKTKKPQSMLNFVHKRLAGDYRIIALLFAVGLALALPGMVVSACTGFFLNYVLVGGNTGLLPILLLTMIIALLLQNVLINYRGYVMARYKVRLSMISTYEMQEHMFRLPIQFFQQRSVGDLAYRIQNNDEVCEFIAGGMSDTLLNVFSIILYLILMVFISPILSVFAVLNLGLSILLMKISDSAEKDISTKLRQDQSKLNGNVLSGLRIIPTLKASGTESEYVARVDGIYAKIIRNDMKRGRLNQILSSITEMTNSVTNMLVLLIGSILVINGSMDCGTLLAFTLLMSYFLIPMTELISFIRSFQSNAANVRRCDDIEKYREDEFFLENSKEKMEKKLTGEILAESISFGYSKTEGPLLSDINFKVEPGSSLAFVGKSGSGKSTIMKLMGGMYMPWEGNLKYDGIPLLKIPMEVLSASVSVISQENGIFNGTVRDNITMFNNNIMETDIIQAAKDACIHDVITSKKDAYDHIMMEEGSDLSGGQKQCLIIARALAVNPSILIMDEATSALDPVVEEQILRNIKRRGITCLIAAHRLSAIRDCDQIIVMEKGRVVQKGSHEELIRVNGCYKTLTENA